MVDREQGPAFNDAKYVEVRREIEEQTEHRDFADYLTLKEVMMLTNSTYHQVYYGVRAKVSMETVKHGVQHFVFWKDAKEYADILRSRRLKKAAQLSKQADNLLKKAERKLARARKTSGVMEKKADKIDRLRGNGDPGIGKRTPVPGEYERVEEEIKPGDMLVADAAPLTGYTVQTLTTYATPHYHLVDSYIVNGRRVIPAAEIERLAAKRRDAANSQKGGSAQAQTR